MRFAVMRRYSESEMTRTQQTKERIPRHQSWVVIVPDEYLLSSCLLMSHFGN